MYSCQLPKSDTVVKGPGIEPGLFRLHRPVPRRLGLPLLVWMERFELPVPCSQSKCPTARRHPDVKRITNPDPHRTPLTPVSRASLSCISSPTLRPSARQSHPLGSTAGERLRSVRFLTFQPRPLGIDTNRTCPETLRMVRISRFQRERPVGRTSRT